MKYLALCCIVKDEDDSIKEWLAYHSLLGVEHFYIYDNDSKYPVRELLEGFADASQVTVESIQGKNIQMKAYVECMQRHIQDYTWMGFIDVDEFACPVQDNDLRILLSEYEDYAGLVATWNVFGSSGHVSRPAGLIIDNFREHFLEKRKKSTGTSKVSSNPRPFAVRPIPISFFTGKDNTRSMKIIFPPVRFRFSFRLIGS